MQIKMSVCVCGGGQQIEFLTYFLGGNQQIEFLTYFLDCRFRRLFELSISELTT